MSRLQLSDRQGTPKVTFTTASVKVLLSITTQGEVRVAKMKEADPEERGGYSGLIPSWHHLECFLERLQELEAEGVSAEELSGFTKLKKPDKEMVAKKLSSKSGSAKGKG